jgi:hypothetical protein
MSMTPSEISIIKSYAGTASNHAASWIWANQPNREILERMMIDDLRAAVAAAGYSMVAVETLAQEATE